MQHTYRLKSNVHLNPLRCNLCLYLIKQNERILLDFSELYKMTESLKSFGNFIKL